MHYSQALGILVPSNAADGYEGVARDSLVRRLAHEAFGWRPTTLPVTVRR